MENELYGYTHVENRLVGKHASVHNSNSPRLKEADKQAKKLKVAVKQIIEYTDEFLKKVGIRKENENIDPRISDFEIIVPARKCRNKRIVNLDYDKIKEDYGLNSKKHIVWMKFTVDGFLGVVARSDDVNFEIPLDESEDNENYNTSGIIIQYLRKKWDESFVLVFPIPNVGDREMGDIECGIGQYLIEKEVPILDFYSHTF